MSVPAGSGGGDADDRRADRRLPGSLNRDTDVDLEGRLNHPFIRRGILSLLALIALAALAGIFGQQAGQTTIQGTQAASLTVEAPDRLRNGLIFSARFDLTAGPAGIERPHLVLSHGWIDHITLNSLYPDPVTQSGDDGSLRLAYRPLQGGQRMTVWTQWQVNPTTTGRFDGDAALFDGDLELARLDRTVTIFP